jgi:hypothetical protein
MFSSMARATRLKPRKMKSGCWSIWMLGYGGSRLNERGAGGLPANNATQQQIKQQCLDQFNNSGLGKAVNFWSLGSPFIGPDRPGSIFEDFGGTTLKIGAYQFFATASKTMGRTPFGSLSGVVAKTTPLVAGATGAQIIMHAGCANSALNATGQANTPVNPGYF